MNMKAKNILLTAAAALALQGCSDWTDHYGCEHDYHQSALEASATLWEQISSSDTLSNFAAVLQKLGYDQVLNTDQNFTVFAPTNAAIDTTALYAEFANDSLLKVEFIQNHIARGFHRASGSIDETVHVLNEKALEFKGGDGAYTFGDIKVGAENIIAKNGMMHIMEGKVDFRPNMYEFMNRNTNGFTATDLYDFFKKYMKKELDLDNSVQGPMKDGEVTYLDSVYKESNDMFDALNAKLTTEDSTYTMILPNNEAWQKALTKAKTYFNLFPAIQSQSINSKTEGSTTTYTKTIGTSEKQTNRDSLVNLYATKALLSSMIYSNTINGPLQGESGKPENAYDSIKSTTMQVLQNTVNYQGTDDTRFNLNDASDLFDGAQKHTVSNGYAWIVTDEVNIRPWRTSICPPIYMKPTYGTYQAGLANAQGQNVTVSSSNRNPLVEGSMHNNAYYQISRSGNTADYAAFYIPNVQSTEYAVYLTLVPEDILDSTVTASKPKVMMMSSLHSAKGESTLRAGNYTGGNTGFVILYKDFGSSSRMSQIQIDFTKNVISGDDETEQKTVNEVKTKFVGVLRPNGCYKGLETSATVYPLLQIMHAFDRTSTSLRVAGITLIPKDAVEYYQEKGYYTDYKGDMPEIFWHLND